MLNKLKLKGKLLLSICTILFFALTTSISIISVKTYNLLKQEALNKTLALAKQYAADVANEVDKPLDGARTLAQLFAGIKSMDTVPDRKALFIMMKEILLQSPKFFGVWTVWEPNALDGRDNEFIDAEAHDKTGRFIPYWNRNGGIHIEYCVDYEDGTKAGYYTKPRSTGKEMVTEPVTYEIGGQQVTVVSACAPIMYKNQFIGLTGCDFSMKTMKELVETIKPYPDTRAMIITNTGIIAAHSDPKMMGKNAKELLSETAYENIKKGKAITEEYNNPDTGQSNIRVFCPIKLGYTDDPWSLVIFFPLNEVMRKVELLNNINLIIGIVTLCVLIISLYLISESLIVRPVKKVVAGLYDIAEGDADTTRRLDEVSKDEIGELAKAFNLFMKRLNGTIKAIKKNALKIDESSTSLTHNAQSMTSDAHQVSEKSGIVVRAADNMNINMSSVAKAMEEASSNINMVASSIGELTSTINEIASNSEQAKFISHEAVDTVLNTSNSMENLGNAAEQIGLVTETIREISEQTNLLALNATIESARAGEAGKGFAVVASEIKELAQKTSEATHEIQEKINGIQDTSQKMVAEIRNITNVIGTMNDIVSNIASAVEEQSIATKEISTSITNASTETSKVGENMNHMKNTSYEISSEIDQLNTAIEKVTDYSQTIKTETAGLAELTAKMSDEVGAFKV
ncbi:MAG: hypothetical protein CSA18_01010 [Deltaproteobacteria bacterium]|nr:MAG: hypothetical protein CSA18_01010 [Deltaproteobacteria bacterium]